MITLQQSPVLPKPLEYLNTEASFKAINKNTTTSFSACKDFYYCSDCHLPVFADLTTTNESLNDVSSFFYNDIGDTETVTATLTNVSTGSEYVITDNTYGLFYDTGVLADNVWGFKLNWRLVAISLGFGDYTFNVKIDNVFVRGDFEENYCYSLKQYSCKGANGTIRITSYKNGYIENGKDYRGLLVGDWVDQIRLYGKITLSEPVVTVDNTIVGPRVKEQIQTQIVENYNLTVRELNDSLSKIITKDYLLANGILINDYNISNVSNIENLSVALLSIDQPIAHEINGTWTYQAQLEERIQTTIKRNY